MHLQMEEILTLKADFGFLTDLQNHLKKSTGNIATVTGRYYAMDRDKRWEQSKTCYDGMVNGIGEKTDDILASVKKSYDEGVTDEFIKPIIKLQHTKYKNRK
ncbi:MAG: hypothetical protein WDM71_04985 [Ferruginibacter sp.]